MKAGLPNPLFPLRHQLSRDGGLGLWGERREGRRIAFARAVQFRWRGRLGGARLIDLSDGGLRLALDPACARAAKRETLRIFIPLPRPGKVRDRLEVFDGLVRWIDASGCGVELLSLSLDRRIRLRDVIRIAAG